MADVAALLAEVKAALQQATPGPWRAIRDGNAPLENGTLVGQSRVDGLPRPSEPRWIGWDNPRAARIAHHSTYLRDEDADLIAHAPEWLGALVQAVEDLREKLGRANEQNQYCHDNHSPGQQMVIESQTQQLHDLRAEVAQLRADGQRLRYALDTIYKIAAGGDVRRTAFEALHPDEATPGDAP